MVLYAREDVDYVFVPVGQGGCGTAHSRPFASGVRSREFALHCDPCENFLRADIARTGNKKVRTVNSDNGMKLAERYLGQWGASPETVPESPDEEKKREWAEQSTITKNAASQTEALAQIGAAVAGNSEMMAKFLQWQMGQSMPAQPLVATPEPVAADHDSFAETRYCLDCKTPIVRQFGQKGALPWRCPPCKAKKNAQRGRKVA